MNFMRIDPIQALFYTAVINGLVAPPLLVLIVLLGSDRTYMKDKVSGPLSRTLTWLATGLMALAAAALLATTFFVR
jgi:Mn2+/Fe2+ NRAMP family transporter